LSVRAGAFDGELAGGNPPEPPFEEIDVAVDLVPDRLRRFHFLENRFLAVSA
jgi:hypothetical protein